MRERDLISLTEQIQAWIDNTCEEDGVVPESYIWQPELASLMAKASAAVFDMAIEAQKEAP